MNKNIVTSLLLLVGVYLFTTGLAYLIFSKTPNLIAQKTAPVPTPSASGGLVFDNSLPKTEVCPLNGSKYSAQQKNWWSQHRPLGVMIENHEDARPQSGLSSADVVYEAVAEGSITRFLAVFYCQDASRIGPVRSARTYFLDFISEYGNFPLYAHVGGANTSGPADAISQINDYDWYMYNDINQISNNDTGFPIFLRDYKISGNENIATEHTMYSSTSKLWDTVAKKRGLTQVDKKGVAWDEKFVPYAFKEDATDKGASQMIHIEPWEGYKQYAVDWTYDPKTNMYLRNNGGKAHIDRNTGKQLETKNLVVLSMQESHANDGYENNAHLLYKNKGTGKATIFMDGKQTVGTWRKSTRTSRTLLFDANGKAIEFDRGVIWFTILPTDGILTVK